MVKVIKPSKLFGHGFFDMREAQKGNLLISGANHSGKTRLACGLVSTLSKFGWQVKVFDTTSVWKEVSDLDQYVTIKEKSGYVDFPETLDRNTIYDISSLVPSDAKHVVDSVTRSLWNRRLDFPYLQSQWLMLVFEEAELYARNIRGKVAQNLYRIAHVGRNIKVRCLFVTTDLALIDPSIIRLCSQRFHGFLNIEENSKRKFRSYYGKDYTKIATEGLETGDFINLHKRKLRVITAPLFRSYRRPTEYKPQPQIVSQHAYYSQHQKQKKKGFLSSLFS